jgi:hypothetical protein
VSASAPIVDLVIPVHDASRPLQRALDSLVLSGLRIPEELRITVVCHNISQADIEDSLSTRAREVVRFLEYNDGEQSPAGPFMQGLRSATGEYVSIMGSDDTLEPGALAAWLAVAERSELTALIPPERHANGNKVATPPIRPFRRGVLDPLKDRLAYRTAPLGLIRRSAIDRLGLDMPSSQRSGSDQLFGVKLWFSGERIGYAKGAPKYVVGADAVSRVTLKPRPAREELQAVAELIAHPFVRSLAPRRRRAIVTKSVRVHIFSAALVRTRDDRWTDEDRATIAELLADFAEAAPGYRRPLSLADRRLLEALESGSASAEALKRMLAARSRFGHPLTVLTRDVRGLLATDGPLRLMVAARLL